MINIKSLLGMAGRRAEGYRDVRPYRLEDDSISTLVSKIPTEIDDDRMCGIEVEVERCYFLANADTLRYRAYDSALTKATGVGLDHIFSYLWSRTNDGSLRNHGIEYVSKLGTTFRLASSSVKALEHFFNIVERDAQVNARTGLHVHVDVRDLQLIDLQRLLLVYSVFEEVLFNYSGSRQKNVFCVPIGETNLPLAELRGIKSLDKLKDFVNGHCKKYTGLNLAPLVTQGTIEFRMHRGTTSAKEINDWLKILSDLFNSVTKQGQYRDFGELSALIPRLLVDDLYTHFLRSVFPKTYNLLLPYLDKEAIETGVSNAKELLLDSSAIPEEYHLSLGKKKKNAGSMVNDWEEFRHLRVARNAVRWQPPPDMVEVDEDDVPEPAPELLRVEAAPRGVNANHYTPEIRALGGEALVRIDTFLRRLGRGCTIDEEGNSLPGAMDNVWRKYIETPFGDTYYIHRDSQVYGYSPHTRLIDRIPATSLSPNEYIFIAVAHHAHRN